MEGRGAPWSPILPYRGAGPALSDLIGGQVPVVFPGMASVIEHIRSGTLRALAVTTSARSELLPDIPAVAEFVPGYEVIQLYGIGAPRNTPAEIVDKLNRVVNAGLADPKLRARLAELGSTPMPMTPAQLQKQFADDTDKWGKVIRAANIKAG
jgi:tripartite-type tricarboxylate transporter receptor subunit TctC